MEGKKVVVLGIDGVPHSLLVSYMERGVMPNLSRLCSEGGRINSMRSTLPEISSVAWSSFITGRNPGEHGIFGFMEIDRQSYEYTFPNFTSLKEMPFWERIDVKTVALNIPQTYPARPFNGVIVSGFVALDLKKATYPERVFNYLNETGYKIDVNAKLAAENPQMFFDDLLDTFERRIKAIKHLYENEDWQLFIGTITETDRLHHFFFDSALEGRHYDIFERFYRELDSFFGCMADKAQKDGASLFACSDHGFTSIKTEVYLNRWLMENGYLYLNGPQGLKGMTSDTKAFCLDPSRIYIHREGRYGKGRINNTEYIPLMNELKDRLLKLEFNGNKVIKDIFVKEDIFHGNYLENGPDLYLLPNYGFDLKGAVNRENVFGVTHFRGMHTYDDAFFYSSVPLDKKELKIEDLASIITSNL